MGISDAILLHEYTLPSGQLHLSGVLPVSPDVRKITVVSWALAGTGSVLFIHQAPYLKVTENSKEKFLQIIIGYSFGSLNFLCASCYLVIMISPGEFKGQRRSACGHMAAFDMPECCGSCKNKKFGQDPCVQDKSCSICDNFSDSQKEILSTPSYRTRKDRKADLLVSPKEVAVLSSVENLLSDSSPVNQSTAQHQYYIPLRRILCPCYGFYFQHKRFLMLHWSNFQQCQRRWLNNLLVLRHSFQGETFPVLLKCLLPLCLPSNSLISPS